MQIGQELDVGGPPEIRACSACAGDYEDPERTAWAAAEFAGAGDEEDAASVGEREELSDSED